MARSKPIEAPSCDRPYTTLTGESNNQGCDIIKLLLKPRWTEAETAYVVRSAIPGLDATYCKCEQCKGQWWADVNMRRRLQKRIYAYNFTPDNGDLCRDKEDS
jgi:hypothetical protein